MELSTIAKPYAQAIFDIAEQGSSHSEWSDLLSTASVIMSDDATQDFVASPNTSKDQKIQLICVLLEKVMARSLNTQESAFINLIINNDRTEAIESIANAFEVAVTNANKGMNFTVVSAFELSATEEKAIVDDLSAKHNTTVNVDTIVDGTLTGGVVIKEGDKVIDTSIKAKVDALSVCLSVN
jgi:F-type H+-transporting ATPase subunit delta